MSSRRPVAIAISMSCRYGDTCVTDRNPLARPRGPGGGSRAARRMVGPQAPWLVRKKDLKPLLRVGQCPCGCAIDYMPGAAPANIDVYLSPGIKTTLISGRNLSDISTVAGRAAIPSTREGVGRPWLASPEVPTSWHDTLQVLEPPSRPVTFHAQPNTRPRSRRNQAETFFS